MKWNSVGVFAVLALAATNASAVPVFDVSVSAGLNHSRLDAFETFSYPTESSSGTKPRVTFNASVGSWLGIEAGWSKLASTTTVVTIVPPGTGGGAYDEELRDSGSALWLAYAPSIEFGAFELTGKVGAVRLSRDFINTRLALNHGDSENEAFVGLAATYWFMPVVGLRLDAERLGSDVSQVGLSLTIGF